MINFNLLSSQSIPGPSPITFNRFQSIAFKFWAILEQKTDVFTFLVKFQVNFSCPKMPVFCLNHRSGPSRSIPNQSGYVQSISSPTGTQKVINLVKKNGLVFTFFMSNFDLKTQKFKSWTQSPSDIFRTLKRGFRDPSGPPMSSLEPFGSIGGPNKHSLAFLVS